MDEERQIRFLIPPFFLAVSLLWGAYASHDPRLTAMLTPQTVKDVIALLGIAAVAAIPTGYLIGSISHSILRILFRIFRQPPFEASLPTETLGRIWPALHTQMALDRMLTMYASVTLDFELTSEGVHGWITRRWSGFNIAYNSTVALELSHLVGYALKIRQSSTWTWTSVVMIAILTYAAVVAYRETMTMLDFQSHRNLKPQTPEERTSVESARDSQSC